MKRHLPVLDDSFLDNIKVATPCSADWEQMAGDDRVRHCGDCRLNVYNVAEMTRAETAALIRINEGKRVCMRLHRRPDGTLITQDCWERLRAARRRGWMAFAAALVIVGLTQLGLRMAALSWLLRWSHNRPPEVMTGAVAVPLSPPTKMGVVTNEPQSPAVAPKERELMGKIAVPRRLLQPPVKTPKVKHAPTMGGVAVPAPKPEAMMGDISLVE